MNREATDKLRLDRRLLNRRGWLSKAEREKELDSLPDVSDKVAPPEADGPEETGASGEPATDESLPGA